MLNSFYGVVGVLKNAAAGRARCFYARHEPALSFFAINDAGIPAAGAGAGTGAGSSWCWCRLVDPWVSAYKSTF
ncbi:hypothetical protein M0804_006801 [Polistes exclamans]|nr:hypothetical protein M0804_006801 [Polistes exclamans]